MEISTLRQCVELAITTEQTGAQRYDQLADKLAENPEVARILKRLADDERDHELQFRGLLKSLPEVDKAVGSDLAGEYLRTLAKSEFFEREIAPLEQPAEIKSPADAMAKAMALEKATVLFYDAMKDLLGESHALDTIIAAEKQHVVTLMKVIMTDAEFRGLSDTW
jgi:rubrerythrin